MQIVSLSKPSFKDIPVWNWCTNVNVSTPITLSQTTVNLGNIRIYLGLDSILISIIDSSGICHCCGIKIVSLDITRRRCLGCHNYLIYPEESINDIIRIRDEVNMLNMELKVNRPFYIVCAGLVYYVNNN